MCAFVMWAWYTYTHSAQSTDRTLEDLDWAEKLRELTDAQKNKKEKKKEAKEQMEEAMAQLDAKLSVSMPQQLQQQQRR